LVHLGDDFTGIVRLPEKHGRAKQHDERKRSEQPHVLIRCALGRSNSKVIHMRSLFAASALIASAILAGAQGATAQENAAFCLRGSDSGGLNCSYNTMAQCEQAKKGASNTESCIPNPRNNTTGSGSGMAPSGSTGGGMGQGSPSPSPSR
jgi:hypothetical protein